MEHLNLCALSSRFATAFMSGSKTAERLVEDVKRIIVQSVSTRYQSISVARCANSLRSDIDTCRSTCIMPGVKRMEPCSDRDPLQEYFLAQPQWTRSASPI
jgi:hypothetical protein